MSFYDFAKSQDNLEGVSDDVLENYSEYMKIATNHVYNDELEVILSKVPSLLTDYAKFYVLCKMNPGSSEYQNFFSNTKSNLTKVKGELMELLTKIHSNTDEINKKMLELDELIKIERKKNKKLKRRLGITDTRINTSSQLISNYTEIYDFDYMRNWALFLSILLIWFITKKVYF
jgi:hypothetical protein